MEKPALTQMASNMITTTANSKLNGTLGFSSLDISLTGQVVLAKPVIKDPQAESFSKARTSASMSIPVRS